jgi:hypothetical protein
MALKKFAPENLYLLSPVPSSYIAVITKPSWDSLFSFYSSLQILFPPFFKSLSLFAKSVY